jgi:hypothetical protein
LSEEKREPEIEGNRRKRRKICLRDRGKKGLREGNILKTRDWGTNMREGERNGRMFYREEQNRKKEAGDSLREGQRIV